MDSRQMFAHILQRTTRLVVQYGSSSLGNFNESIPNESGRQALQEFLVRLAKLFVDVIS